MRVRHFWAVKFEARVLLQAVVHGSHPEFRFGFDSVGSPVVWSRIAPRGYLSGPVARAWKTWSRCPLLVLPNAIGRKEPKRLANEMVGASVRESLLSQGPPVLRFFGSFRRDFPTSLVSLVRWVSVRVSSVPLIPSKIHGF